MDNVNAACKTYKALKSPITIEDAAKYVAVKLLNDKIDSFFCLCQWAGTATLSKDIIDLSDCTNIDNATLSKPIETVQQIVYAKIENAIGNHADKWSSNTLLQSLIPIKSIRIKQKKAHFFESNTIIGFTDDREFAEKWSKLPQWDYAYMSDSELSEKWNSYNEKLKRAILTYKFNHLKDLKPENRNVYSFISRIIHQCNPFCAISNNVEEYAAQLTYHMIIGLKGKNISYITEEWVKFFAYANAEDIVEILTNSEGLDFTIDTQPQIIRIAFGLRDKAKIDFIPLLKKYSDGRPYVKDEIDDEFSTVSVVWKTAEEMEEVRTNENHIPELCINGVSMQDAIARQNKSALEYVSATMAQQETNAALTNAIYTAQIAQLEIQIEQVERDFINHRIGLVEKSQIVESLKRQIGELSKKCR